MKTDKDDSNKTITYNKKAALPAAGKLMDRSGNGISSSSGSSSTSIIISGYGSSSSGSSGNGFSSSRGSSSYSGSGGTTYIHIYVVLYVPTSNFG